LLNRLLLILAATAALGGCISISRAPAIVVPQGASVICPGGAPATLSNGTYHC